MMFSLNPNSIRDVLKRRGSRALSVIDLPKYTIDQFGLHALNLTTELLKGLSPDDIAKIRDSGDRAGCACLMLTQRDPISAGDKDEDKADQAVDRIRRVIRAAGILGCNSVSIRLKGKDTDDVFDRTAETMRRALETADKAEMNLLIEPAPGLTEDPERLTDLVKGIGGFRIGTMPDFATAAESGDPVAYLKRLTPYAAVVNASTLGFTLPDQDGDGSGGGKGDDTDPKADKDPDAAPGGLEDLAAELEGMMDAPPPEHEGFDLHALVGAIAAVGFDGNIALDYRGEEDGTLGVLHAKDAIEAALKAAAE